MNCERQRVLSKVSYCSRYESVQRQTESRYTRSIIMTGCFYVEDRLMGVITTRRLEAGEKFGPVPPTLTLAEPTVLIGHRTCDTLPDIHTVKVSRV